MGTMQFSTYINAPADRVFANSIDFEHAPDRISGIDAIEMLTEGPAAVGTRFRETRTIMGKQATEEMEVTTFDPGRSYTLGCDSCGARYETLVESVPEGDGTLCRMTMNWKPTTLGAKVMGPIMGVFMKGMMRKCIEQDLADMKAAAESNA